MNSLRLLVVTIFFVYTVQYTNACTILPPWWPKCAHQKELQNEIMMHTLFIALNSF